MAKKETTIIRRMTFSALVVAWISILGCQSDTNNEISRTVSFQGELLPRGIINFFGEDNRPRGGPISPDGTFACRLPPGNYRVTVVAPPVIPDGWKETEPMPKDDIGLPDKYAQPGTSGVTVEIKDNPQPLEFHLTS
jgi:hypothetical protein